MHLERGGEGGTKADWQKKSRRGKGEEEQLRPTLETQEPKKGGAQGQASTRKVHTAASPHRSLNSGLRVQQRKRQVVGYKEW